MNIFFNLIKNDWRRIARDKTMLAFITIPFLLLAFVRYAVPPILLQFPILNEYTQIILIFASVQSSVIFGFVSGFMFLEEKDENVFEIQKILPIGPYQFVFARLSFTFAMSAIGSLLILSFNGLINFEFSISIMTSVQYAMCGVLLSIIIASFAKNKIEGMALFKGLDVLILLPIVSLFFKSNWMSVFGFIPTYWTYNTFYFRTDFGLSFMYFLAGLAYYLLFIFVFIKRWGK